MRERIEALRAVVESCPVCGNTSHDLLCEREEVVAKDPAQALKNCADAWSRFDGIADDYVDAASDVVDACEDLGEAVDKKDAVEIKNAAKTVELAMREMSSVRDTAYGYFATGRDWLYALASLWGISVKKSQRNESIELDEKSGTDLGPLSNDEIVRQMVVYGKELIPGLQEMVKIGTRLARDFEDAAKDPGRLTGSDKAKFVSQGLSFRDGVSNVMFRKVNGIGRRAAELLKRATGKSVREAIDGLRLVSSSN